MNFERAVILHGKPKVDRYKENLAFDPSVANWLGWLADELQKRGVSTISPVIEKAWEPDFEKYITALDKHKNFLAGREPGGLIVAHSAAVGPAIEWAIKNESFEGTVVALAPWIIGPTDKYPKMRLPESMDRVFRVFQSGEVGLRLLYSEDDTDDHSASLDWLNSKIPFLKAENLGTYGHFVTGNSMEPDYSLGNGLYGSTFPELMRVLEEI